MAGGILRRELEQIVSDRGIPWRDMSGASVLITGATGLIGSALVRALAAANEEHGLNLQVIGHGRNPAGGGALRRECGIEFIGGDVRRPIPTGALPPTLDYILHGAAVTRSADMVAKPADVIATAFEGTWNALMLAKERGCRSFVYLSSMEVYGRVERRVVDESDLGYLDVSSPRSAYPESKRMCELLCACFASQHGVPAKIARLAQTFGPGTPISDSRVFAQFARSAMAGRDLELHTEGKSRGNYCHISDAVRGLLTILLKGATGETYNIANPGASVTIREMAELVAADICEGGVKVVVNIPGDIAGRGYAPDAASVLSANKLGALGWRPEYGLAEMYRGMIAAWREEDGQSGEKPMPGQRRGGEWQRR